MTYLQIFSIIMYLIPTWASLFYLIAGLVIGYSVSGRIFEKSFEKAVKLQTQGLKDALDSMKKGGKSNE